LNALQSAIASHCGCALRRLLFLAPLASATAAAYPAASVCQRRGYPGGVKKVPDLEDHPKRRKGRHVHPIPNSQYRGFTVNEGSRNVRLNRDNWDLVAESNGRLLLTTELLDPLPDSPLYELVKSGQAFEKVFVHVVRMPEDELKAEYQLVSLLSSLSLSARLLHTSRAALAIPKGPEREEFIDQGSAKILKSMEAWKEQTKTGLSSVTERFERLHEIYYGKDRDFTNYPPVKMQPHMPKVRLGILPDSWFQAFYNKTGVLGPYILALGVPTFLISKEYWVLDPEGMVLLVSVPALIAFVKKYGQRIKEMEAKKANELDESVIVRPIEAAKDSGRDLVRLTESQLQSFPIVFEEAFKAKREILDLQLEEEYRRRLAEVARTVERRMTYHVELAAAKKSFQQQHLVQWVLDGVTKSITPQQEKEAIQQCIRELRALAPKAA
uniref:ATP synthase subunit b n=1 Tax=Macrostomum lignano TaxID=282301 RepID=A0A1I8JCZ6_9PLAT